MTVYDLSGRQQSGKKNILKRAKFGINRGNPECVQSRKYISVLLLTLSFHWRNFKSPRNLWNCSPLSSLGQGKKDKTNDHRDYKIVPPRRHFIFINLLQLIPIDHSRGHYSLFHNKCVQYIEVLVQLVLLLFKLSW